MAKSCHICTVYKKLDNRVKMIGEGGQVAECRGGKPGGSANTDCFGYFDRAAGMVSAGRYMMVNKIKPLCDCGQPIDCDSPEYTTERSERGGERVFRRRPIKCQECREKDAKRRAKAFWMSWEAKEREIVNNWSRIIQRSKG